MKTKIKSISLLWAMIAAIMMTVACSDEEDGYSGTPQVFSVRRTNPTSADSTFTDAYPGSMIAIIGENFGGLQSIYMNDQKVSFNINYTTTKNIICTIPSDIELVGTNPNASNEIRIMTDHGECSYAFHFLSPAPFITRIAIDYPAEPADTARIIGGNFYEIQRIYLTTADSIGFSGTEYDITDYSVNADYTTISAVLPSVIEHGYMVVECYTDEAWVEFFRDLPVPTATSVSSTMPVIGARAFITGTNFMNVQHVSVNDEYTIPNTDLEVAPSADTIFFALPSAPTHSGRLKVVTLGGESEVPGIFYPVETCILNFDALGELNWGGFTQITPEVTTAPFTAYDNCYGIIGTNPAWNRWWDMGVLCCKNIVYPEIESIPASTKLSDLAIQFELYSVYPMVNGNLKVALLNGDNWTYAQDGYVPTFTEGSWQTCTFDMALYGTEATYGDIAAFDGFAVQVYNYTGNEEIIEMYFDNFRIVKK